MFNFWFSYSYSSKGNQKRNFHDVGYSRKEYVTIEAQRKNFMALSRSIMAGWHANSLLKKRKKSFTLGGGGNNSDRPREILFVTNTYRDGRREPPFGRSCAHAVPNALLLLFPTGWASWIVGNEANDLLPAERARSLASRETMLISTKSSVKGSTNTPHYRVIFEL